MKDQILDFFFPKRCLGCGRVDNFVCPVCEEDLPVLQDQSCAVCQNPSVGGFTHYRCQGLYRPERSLSFLVYKGLTQKLIQGLKYEKVFALVPLLVEYLFQFVEESNLSLGEKTVITFIPSHPFKIFERGFNPVELLANELSHRLNLERLPLLEKIKETSSQTSLSKEARLKNVEGSFRVKGEWATKIKGRDILLLDDVFTTGSTLLECSKVLKKSGVRFIYLLTLAKD